MSAEIRKLVRRGYSEARAIAAALDVARRKGFKVPAKVNALQFRDLPIGAWFEFAGWSISFSGPFQKISSRSYRDRKGKRFRVGSVQGLVERAKAPNPTAPKRRAKTNGIVIGDSALALSYEGGQGKRSGKMRGPWEHEFESDDVEIIGRKDGSVLLRSRSGERLWDHFEV